MLNKFVKLLKVLQMFILIPVELIWILVYFTCSQKDKIDMDFNTYAVHQHRESMNRLLLLVMNLMWSSDFRKLFLYRIGDLRSILKFLMGRGVSIGFDVPREKFGGGLYIQHGHGTVISARSVGENCMINQLVTIGYKGDGCPAIGNNVRIGSSAIIIGDIKIGNNVNIGAGAIVVHDVPDNCTVCSPEATIVKRHNPPEAAK